MQKSRGGYARRNMAKIAIGALGTVTLMLWSAMPAGATTPTPNSAGAYWASFPTVGENAYAVSAGATFVVPTLNCAGNTKTLGESFGVEQGARRIHAPNSSRCVRLVERSRGPFLNRPTLVPASASALDRRRSSSATKWSPRLTISESFLLRADQLIE